MRFYTIALFLFAFNLIIGVLNDSGSFDTIAEYQWNIPATAKNYTYLGDSATAIQSGTEFGDVISMVGMFISVVLKAVFVPGWYLGHILDPSLAGQIHPLTLMVDGMVWFIYIVGLTQFISNRQVEPLG